MDSDPHVRTRPKDGLCKLFVISFPNIAAALLSSPVNRVMKKVSSCLRSLALASVRSFVRATSYAFVRAYEVRACARAQ
eukprot:3121119-Pleurochrysis_carterae.AAC.2